MKIDHVSEMQRFNSVMKLNLSDAVPFARRVWQVLLVLMLMTEILVLGSCSLVKGQDEVEALGVVQEYLQALKTGDLDQARGFWADINNPGGTWTMVAERDMLHVTLEHSESFHEGVEVVKSEYQSVKGLDKTIGVIRMEVRVPPEGKIRKLEIGLVLHEGRWFIYSIYPGTW